MRTKTAFYITLFCVIVSFLSGCAPKANLALNFSPQESITYKVVNETRKDYRFEQPSANKTTDKTTLTRSELTLEQKIISVEGNGDALADIKIKALTYLAKTQDGINIDFDSSREADGKEPLAKLVGQSYTIKLSPSGQVTEVLNVKQARDAVKGGADDRIAAWLLSDKSVKKRHTILAMPDAVTSELSPGDSWSRIKASPPGMLSQKSYEKVYTLKNITDRNGQRIATVEMNAIASAEKAEDFPEKSMGRMGFFAKMFDSTDTFSGQLVINLDTGKIDKYSEKLKADWIAVDPAKDLQSEEGPDVLTMGFTWIHSIEAVD